jgi:hypothetical protein
MDVIQCLNRIGTNSLLIQRSDLSLIFLLNYVDLWPKCSVQKVVPNNLLYLQKKFHIFMRSLSIFLKFLLISALMRNCFEKYNFLFLNVPDPPTRSDPLSPKSARASLAHRSATISFFPQILCALPRALAAGNPGAPFPPPPPMLAYWLLPTTAVMHTFSRWLILSRSPARRRPLPVAASVAPPGWPPIAAPRLLRSGQEQWMSRY